MMSPLARCKSLIEVVLLARALGSCYICFSATADRSGLTSRSDHKRRRVRTSLKRPHPGCSHNGINMNSLHRSLY